MLTAKKKQNIIGKYKVHDKDTGSSEVQVAILTGQIKALTGHLKKHKQDNSSRRGLLKMVADRRALMNYLSKKDKKRHETLAKKLNLKKSKKE
ncbi:MAG TPA: 30S ribosomal protein S15 [Candidatus Paceibacterota bacterium]